MKCLMAAIYKFNMFLVWVAKLSLLAMTMIVTTVVFMRFVLNTGLSWGEEIPLVLVIWFTFISMAIGVKLKLHINMDVLPSKLPASMEFGLKKISDIVTIVVGLIMLYYGSKLAWITRNGTLPGCGLSSTWLYLPLGLSGLMILLDGFLDLLGLDKHDSHFEAEAEGSDYKKEEACPNV